MAPVKICGLSTRPTLDAALEGGAAFVGFMSFAASPRHVPIAEAATLAAAARGRAKVVIVTVDPDDEMISRLLAKVGPDFVQLHGRESPRRVREIAERVNVIKAIPVSGPDDLAEAQAYEDGAAHLMFDAKAPADSSRPGGLGEPFDWALLSGRAFKRPWFLAGGLNPDNVAAAIRASGAPMVDVSSGVEAASGLKQPALITRFLDAVRRV
jgi:phosphoribosylanthranilate isomerase